MTDTPSQSVALYGTEEMTTEPRTLRAGKLSAELENGNLRYVRFDGAEVMRAISFIVRDKDWGTYNPQIANLHIEEKQDRFIVTLSATCTDDSQSFSYDARIEGHANGQLVFSAKGKSHSGFLTNRTGFVVLHPIDGVSGAAVEITHTDGNVEQSIFPEIIDPVQPMMDLRTLKHTTPTGLLVTCLMEGDTFEMEDQRNWTDASYKTYVRPLALPWPYRLEPTEVIDQKITLTVSGEASSSDATTNTVIMPGQTIGSVPPLGMGLRPENIPGLLTVSEKIEELAPTYLILHHDPRSGHDRSSIEKQLTAANRIGADPWLEVVIESVSNSAAATEIAALGELAATLGSPFSTILVSPAPDLKCTLPGSPWPDAPDAAALYAATQAAFPYARIGGGMFSYFTELNRKRPPLDNLDLLGYTTSPMVHAGDDRSVMETRESHPAIVNSVARIAEATPWVVGPSAIGVRDNPYGDAAKDNPKNIRQAMNWNDPRQRGLLGAVWNLGYFADFATGGASAIALGEPTGPFGVVASDVDFPMPWYDEHKGLFPVFHVLRGLSRLKGMPMLSLNLPASGKITGFSVTTDSDEIEFWLGNTGPEPTTIELGETLQTSRRGMAMLDHSSFVAAASAADYMDQTHPVDSISISLPSFAILRLVVTL